MGLEYLAPESQDGLASNLISNHEFLVLLGSRLQEIYRVSIG